MVICFAWSGFPQYAARCVGAFVKATHEKVVVVATRPRVPIEGMESLCGCPVHWIESGATVNCEKLLGSVPDVAFVSGWGLSVFNQIRDQVRENGGHVIAMVDNNYQFSLCECVKAMRFRLTLRAKYDGFFVPGESGVRLLRFYGVPSAMIRKGLYSADASLFRSEVPILDRPKRVIYVGQLCERKNVRLLVQVFQALSPSFPDWSLDLYGSGPLAAELSRRVAEGASLLGHPSPITIHPFAQPEELSKLYQRARVFILPSKEEHWGLVVHEAALSGCVLLTSSQVGAAEDLVSAENGRCFDAYSEKEMAASLRWAMNLKDADALIASSVSVKMSANASIRQFVDGALSLVDYGRGTR